MPARSLDSAGRVQFRKQSNQHALSLTNPANQTQVANDFRWYRERTAVCFRVRNVPSIFSFRQPRQLHQAVHVQIGRAQLFVVLAETVRYSHG